MRSATAASRSSCGPPTWARNPPPSGAGFHPAFTVGDPWIDQTRLEIPARGHIPVDERLLPIGPPTPLDGGPYDFRRLQAIGGRQLDTCFADFDRSADGLARVRLLSGDAQRAVTLWMDGGFGYLQAYTCDAVPDPRRRRHGVTLEPMTCAPDAFNSGEGLVRLGPGKTFAARCGLMS
jgi:aldose 1-epimerase